MSRRRIAAFVIVMAVTSATSCKQGDKADGNVAPPPPMPVASAGACTSGGGEVGDAVSAAFFPRAAGAYCLDPEGQTKTYGEKAKLSMDDVCTTALDGECEVYKRFGLKRLVALRYVDGAGSGGTVEVYLSTFADKAGAYGMFTKRVIADGDPIDPSAPRPLTAGGAGALGTGRAYVWRDAYLAELQYNNEVETPEQLARSSEPLLTAIGKAIGDKLPGTTDKPDGARRLPSANLIANGIEYAPKDALGFAGIGPAATGFYKDGAKRYRLLSIVRESEAEAKDAMKTLRARAGTLPVGGVGDEAVRVVVQAAPETPKVEWLIARRGAVIAGAGDEEFALKAGDPATAQAAARLSKDEAMAKVKAWLGAK